MGLQIFLSLIIGFIIGFLLELFYRSYNAKKYIRPTIFDCQIYALTGAFLTFVYILDVSFIIKLLLIYIFPTFWEFLTGYIYLKITNIYLWDYGDQKFNFKKLICLKFSIIWFTISLLYYLFILPLMF